MKQLREEDKIIQNIKEFDYDKYYYFYSNNYNDDIFGIEKTISEKIAQQK